MNASDAMALMLLVAHFLALGVAVMVFVGMLYLQRRNRAARKADCLAQNIFTPPVTGSRPTTWLAVRTLEPETVRSKLAMTGEFFISPRVNGWVIVTGRGLPEPGHDVDQCFRFLVSASRQLGHLQFFHAEKFSGHHAWARMDEGCVTRAYAWAEETIWNQGVQTVTENGLGLNCYDYAEEAGIALWIKKERAMANIEKIPLLAARWSLDPEILYRTDGITGESSQLY